MQSNNFQQSKFVKAQVKHQKTLKIHPSTRPDSNNDKTGFYVQKNGPAAQKKTGKYYSFPKTQRYERLPSANNYGNIKVTKDGKHTPPQWSKFYQDTRSLLQ